MGNSQCQHEEPDWDFAGSQRRGQTIIVPGRCPDCGKHLEQLYDLLRVQVANHRSLDYYDDDNPAIQLLTEKRHRRSKLQEEIEWLEEILRIAETVDCDYGAVGFDTTPNGEPVINVTADNVKGAVKDLIEHEGTSPDIDWVQSDQCYKIRIALNIRP